MFIRKPPERDRSLQQLLQELAPVSFECLSSVHWPVLVSSTWAQHWSSWYESPRCQHHDASAALGCGPNGVTRTLFSFPHFAALTRVSSCHCSSLARTWSWCRPKKEDWLKKKDRYQRRPGSGRKKSESTGWAPVPGPSGAFCQSRWAPVLGPALTCSLSLTVILSSCSGPGSDLFSVTHCLPPLPVM